MEKEIVETIEKGVSELKADIDTKADAIKVSELEEKVKALESQPIQSKSVGIIVPEYYHGVKVSGQMESLRKEFSSDEMADAAIKMMLDVTKRGMSLEKSAANQVEGTTTAGGYLVLDEFDSVITKTAREMSVMVPLCNNKTVSRTDTFNLPSQNANVSVAWDAEGTVTNTSATYDQSSISVKRLSGYVSISNELLADDAYDVVGDITEQFAYATAQELDNQILNGTGSPCSGVLTAAAGSSVVMTLGNFSSITADDLSLMITQLSTIDAMNATYVMGKLPAHYIRTLKDSNNSPIYQEIAGGNPSQIFGTPRVIANKATSTTGTSTAFVALGDFKQFYIINRTGNLELLVDPYSDSISNNTRFIWKTRKGLGIARSSAFVRLVTGT